MRRRAVMRAVAACLTGLLLLAFAVAPIRMDEREDAVDDSVGVIELGDGYRASSRWSWHRPQFKTKMPERMELDVPLIAQNPELPNGCEATSLTMLLQYLGFDADKMDIAYDHMPRGDVIWRDGQAVAPDPETTYIGNPGDRSGYYILVPGLIDTAESYLKDQESTLRAADVSGIDEEGLVELVARRVPVVVWVTKSYEDVAYDDDEWSTVLDSETFHPYHNLHCVLIVGYDEDSFLINDPLEDKAQQVPRDTFMHGFSELGERAMIVSSAPVID